MGSTTNCQCKCRNNTNDLDMNFRQNQLNAQGIEDNLQIIEQKQQQEFNNIIKESSIKAEVRFQRAYPTILFKNKIGQGSDDIIPESQEFQENSIRQVKSDNNADKIFANSFDKIDLDIDPIAHLSESKNSNKEIFNTSTEGFNKNLIQQIDKKEISSLKLNLAAIQINTKKNAIKELDISPRGENVLSLKEFASLRNTKNIDANYYFIDKKLTLKKIKATRDINFNSIISLITLKNSLNDNALFHSELKKLQYGDVTSKNKVKYSSKFCVITKREFRSYVSKEKFIMLHKPTVKILLKEIKTVTLVVIEGEFKCNIFYFMMTFNKKDTYEVYGSENEEIINKWVVVLNYMINEFRYKIID